MNEPIAAPAGQNGRSVAMPPSLDFAHFSSDRAAISHQLSELGLHVDVIESMSATISRNRSKVADAMIDEYVQVARRRVEEANEGHLEQNIKLLAQRFFAATLADFDLVVLERMTRRLRDGAQSADSVASGLAEFWKKTLSSDAALSISEDRPGLTLIRRQVALLGLKQALPEIEKLFMRSILEATVLALDTADQERATKFLFMTFRSGNERFAANQISGLGDLTAVLPAEVSALFYNTLVETFTGFVGSIAARHIVDPQRATLAFNDAKLQKALSARSPEGQLADAFDYLKGAEHISDHDFLLLLKTLPWGANWGRNADPKENIGAKHVVGGRSNELLERFVKAPEADFYKLWEPFDRALLISALERVRVDRYADEFKRALPRVEQVLEKCIDHANDKKFVAAASAPYLSLVRKLHHLALARSDGSVE